MANIVKPRKIIDRKALKSRLDELVSWSGYTPKTQGQVLDIFKDAHQTGWDEVRRRFEEGEADGPETTRAMAYLVDQVVRTLYEFATVSVYPAANPTMGEQMALMATGGYGRGEMAPYSDIDLMFLLPYKLTPHSEQVVEFILYMLWDLRLKVGHATRSSDEALRLANDDLTIRTSLLEARWLSGNQKLAKAFKKRFRNELVDGSGPAFVEAKLGERDERHGRMGDTRYVLEPNLKEGKGGLRDLQTLFWIAKYLYQAEDAAGLKEAGVLTSGDVRIFAKAEHFLWTVRCHLHYLAGRPEERLTFNVQEELGRRMGYKDHAGARGVERFMKHYFLTAKDVGDLTRILCAVLEEQQTKKRSASAWLSGLGFGKKQADGFSVEGGRVTITGSRELREEPLKILKLFHAAQHHDLDIHPRALRSVKSNLGLVGRTLREDADANRLFVEMLTGPDPKKTLMRLNESGVFGRFIPDFGRVVAQMQYDMYHVYTVDEHTIRAIGLLAGIETQHLLDDHPVACSVIKEVQSRAALYASVLLHDIAKGRGGDHSELGAEIALKLCPRLGLNEWETETVAWLVRQHLLMSNVAFKRDLDDPKAIADFVEEVQSPERLRLLLILTVVDIRAVGPNVWNTWKAGLLRELYWRAQELLSGGAPQARRAERVLGIKARLLEHLSAWPEDEAQAYLDLGHDGYWLGTDTDTLVHHASVVHAAREAGEPFRIELRNRPDRGIAELTVYAPDHPGLFASIAGAMALFNANILDAKVHTLTDGMALDTFAIHDDARGNFSVDSDFPRLKARIADAIQGKLRPARELAKDRDESFTSRTDVFKVPPRALIDNRASNTHTVIEINGRDRPGLLHDVTSVITGDGLQVSSALISTYGERVVDVFYVKDVFGLKIDRQERIDALKQRILDAIVEDEVAEAQQPAAE
ncbi:MAG: [protein-PII] uridylyltransferase [Rhodospirillaceae bacterium]|jgi:[protein-PII] uridylyltransferase|nr:[protein-PII] uridylyltransferase [Rhodospirillaceae bacterium]